MDLSCSFYSGGRTVVYQLQPEQLPLLPVLRAVPVGVSR